jgi:DNA polymerase-1
MVRQSAERAAANMPIQGTEADLMKRAMIVVDQMLSDRADQLLQIHDSILVECDESDAEDIANQMRDIMENIAPELPIRLRVDVSVGDNWGEA